MDEEFAEELKALFKHEGITIHGRDQYLEGDYIGTDIIFTRLSDMVQIDAEDLLDRYL